MVAGMVSCLATSGLAKHKKEESEDFATSHHHHTGHHHKKHMCGEEDRFRGDFANLEDIEDEMVNPSMRSGVTEDELASVRNK